MKQWGEVNLYEQGDFLLTNSDYFEIIFSENVADEEFSLKFYNTDGQHLSLQLTNGFRFKFNDLKTLLDEQLGSHLYTITLMYRQSNYPKSVKLNTTLTYSADDEILYKNDLPTPLHSKDAIVTPL